jgi:DNA-binding transcriptional MerR regulator
MAEAAGGAPQMRRKSKAPGAFRTISEVATVLEVPQHVLRFWESKFSQIKPLKRGGGRRYYRPEDVDLLRGIRHLLYSDGYTIKGVQRLLREIGSKTITESGRSLSGPGGAGAAGVAAARTRRQSSAPKPLADIRATDNSVSNQGISVQAAPDGARANPAKGTSAGESGLKAAQRDKLLELAAELGALRQLLDGSGTK